jgi:hypothetical protein
MDERTRQRRLGLMDRSLEEYRQAGRDGKGHDSPAGDNLQSNASSFGDGELLKLVDALIEIKIPRSGPPPEGFEAACHSVSLRIIKLRLGEAE